MRTEGSPRSSKRQAGDAVQGRQVAEYCCCSLVTMSYSFATPWTVALQAPLFMGFLRQESWSRLLFPSPGDLPDPGMEPASPALAGRFFTTKSPGKPDWILEESITCLFIHSLLNFRHWNRKLARNTKIYKLHFTSFRAQFKYPLMPDICWHHIHIPVTPHASSS